MRRLGFSLLVLTCGCKPTGAPASSEPSNPAKSPAEHRAQEVSPQLVSQVEGSMDLSADPCEDFYTYACGGWMAQAEIPPDRPKTSRFNEQADVMMEQLRHMVTEESSPSEPLGRYFSQCMDEAAVEAAAPQAIAALLALVGDAKNPEPLARAVARVQQAAASPLMELYTSGDASRSGYTAAYLYQGGTGLPSAAAYGPTKDEDAASLLLDYQALVTRTLKAASLPRPEASGRRVVEFERRLAQVAAPPAELRAPGVGQTPVSVASLAEQAPGFEWSAWLDELSLSGIDHVFVVPDGYLTRVAEVVSETKPWVLRAYLHWTLLRTYAGTLNKSIADDHFAFFRTRLRGQAQQKPRWETCVGRTFKALPDEVDRRWIAHNFPESAKARAEALVDRVHAQLTRRLGSTVWLDEPTRAEALRKAEALGHKVGHPARWPETSAKIGEGYAANELHARRAEVLEELAKVGQPVDPATWPVAAIMFNAFYDPHANELLAPAGMLQPPHFHPTWPLAMQLGGIGTVMGHELTHGFDSRGRTIDARGEARDWWTNASEQKYLARTGCVADYYSTLEVAPGVTLDGKLVLGEAIADLGGISLAFEAYLEWAEAQGQSPSDRSASTSITAGRSSSPTHSSSAPRPPRRTPRSWPHGPCTLPARCASTVR